MCAMLVSNGLFHWTQLGKLRDITALSGVAKFADDEIQALRDLQHNGRQAPMSPRSSEVVAIQPGVLVSDVSAGRMDNVPSKFQLSDVARGKGPMAAIMSLKLEEMTPQQRSQWAETVGIAFVLH